MDIGMMQAQKQQEMSNLKFLIHIDSDYTGDDNDGISRLSILFKQQWDSGTIVMPKYVSRVVVIDYYGRMTYEWTRPACLVFNCPVTKKKGWFW